MKKINCSIIQDLLPLYVDGVVSQESKEMIEDHLKNCEECKKELAFMGKELSLPIEKKASILKGLNKKWRNKKVMVSGISILLTTLILCAVFYYVYHFETVIPYSKPLVQIETQDKGELVARYYGNDYYSVKSTHPVTVEIDGQEKSVLFLYYTETIAHSPSTKLLKNNDTRDKSEFIFPLDQAENVDAVYYAKFDIKEAIEEEIKWDSVQEQAELIWEK